MVLPEAPVVAFIKYLPPLSRRPLAAASLCAAVGADHFLRRSTAAREQEETKEEGVFSLQKKARLST